MSGESILNFEGYVVKDFSFRLNPNCNFDDKISQKLKFNFSFEHVQIGPERFEVQVKTAINDPDFSKGNAPFYLDSKVAGYYKIKNFDLDSETHRALVEKNTIAILFPFIRSMIAHCTAEFQIPPVSLPVMNIVEIYEKNKKSKIGQKNSKKKVTR